MKPHNRVSVQTDSTASLSAAAAAGMGLTAVPSLFALRYENLRRIAPPNVIDTREGWLLMPGDLRRVARVRALWDYLVDVFEAWRPLLSGERVPPGREAAALCA